MGSLRVISGVARGKRLKSVPGNSTRPITDRAKESLFNILAPDLPGSTMLDLFAGTGSVGIEALSRGAAYVLFVEKNRKAWSTIRYNLEITGFTDLAKVLKTDAFHLLEGDPLQPFDYIFIAPPQYKGLWVRALMQIDNRYDWLQDNGWVIVQIHPVEYKPVTLSHLEEFQQRKYGSTLFVFYKKIPG